MTKKAHDSEFRAVFSHQPAPFRAKRQSTRAEEVHRHQVARAARHPFDDSADSRRRRGAARGARGRATEASSPDPGRDAARVLDRRAHPSISRRDGAHGDPQCGGSQFNRRPTDVERFAKPTFRDVDRHVETESFPRAVSNETKKRSTRKDARVRVCFVNAGTDGAPGRSSERRASSDVDDVSLSRGHYYNTRANRITHTRRRRQTKYDKYTHTTAAPTTVNLFFRVARARRRTTFNQSSISKSS